MDILDLSEVLYVLLLDDLIKQLPGTALGIMTERKKTDSLPTWAVYRAVPVHYLVTKFPRVEDTELGL